METTSKIGMISNNLLIRKRSNFIPPIGEK
jgi:hypothetical protein